MRHSGAHMRSCFWWREDDWPLMPFAKRRWIQIGRHIEWMILPNLSETDYGIYFSWMSSRLMLPYV